jgi:hypothetical protein
MFDRSVIMSRLLAEYAVQCPVRAIIRHDKGVPVRPELLQDLLIAFQAMVWPTTPRERPKIQADRYMILQKPIMADLSKDDGIRMTPSTTTTTTTSKRAQREAAKLARYQTIWELAVQAIQEVDLDFCTHQFTALAVTHNFRGSPHIDTLNVGPFYGLSLGDFHESGGKICVECSPTLVAEVTTKGRMAKIDGRFPHWVSAFKGGDRYSLIYYQTRGPVVPQTTAIFRPSGAGGETWVDPPVFVP